jgi:hypothetical protein
MTKGRAAAMYSRKPMSTPIRREATPEKTEFVGLPIFLTGLSSRVPLWVTPGGAGFFVPQGSLEGHPGGTGGARWEGGR